MTNLALPLLLVLAAPLAVRLLVDMGLSHVRSGTTPGRTSLHAARQPEQAWIPRLASWGMAMAVTIWAAAFSEGVVLTAGAILGWWLLALARIDWRHLILPNVLTLSLTGMGLATMAFLRPEVLIWHVASAAAGYLSFRLVAEAYRRLRGRDGLGQGDAKLMAAAGAWVGLAGLVSAVLVGALAGLAFVVFASLVGSRHGHHDRLPFGVFLCLGIWITWAYGPVISSA